MMQNHPVFHPSGPVRRVLGGEGGGGRVDKNIFQLCISPPCPRGSVCIHPATVMPPPPSPFSIHRLISECNKLFMYLRWWYQLRLLLIKMGCVSVISWLIQSFVGELIECLIVIVSKRRGRAIAGRFRSCWVINLVSLLDIPIQGRSGAVSDRFQTGFRAVQEEMCAVDYQEISEQL